MRRMLLAALLVLLPAAAGLARTTVPVAPSALTAIAASSTQVNLAWTDNSNNETGFKIERSTNGTTFTQVGKVGTNITQFSDTGRAPATTYFYRVRAYNTGSNSAYSNTASATTPAAPPAAPSGLTATAVSSAQVNLAWTDNANNESGFYIERSPDGTNFAQIATVAANAVSYADTSATASTTYYYRIRAYNAAGNSAYSNTASATTPAMPPAAPSGLTATAASSTQVNLTWTDNANNESGFYVERSPDGTNFAQIATVAANAVSYADTSAAASTTYYYRVRAYNAAGNSAYSNTASATTPAVLPAAPTGLTATAASSTQVNLAWTDNANNESGFYVERSPDGTNFAQIATVAANAVSYADTSAAASTAYYYRVRAYNGGGNSAYSNTATATTPAPPAAAPSGLSATAASSNRVNLVWTDNANNEQGFYIERSTDGTNFAQIAAAAADAVSYADTSATASTTYYYQVRAYNGGGNSAYSNTATATTPAVPPAAPSALTAAASSSTQVNLAWTDNAGNEQGFYIERSPDGTNFTQVAAVGANTVSYADTSATASTSYYYQVRAYNTGGNSAYSNTATATTPAPPPVAPSGLNATAISSTQVDLAWTDNAGNEQGFYIERSPDGTTFAQIAAAGANAASYSDNSAGPSTSYYYQVRAYNTGGNSDYSNTASVTTPAAPPAAPSGLTATAISSTQVNLAWIDNATNEQGFYIERSPDGTNFTQIAAVGANTVSYADTSAAASTSYYYQVRAYNAAGNSAYSNTATATTSAALTIPVAPSALNASTVSSTQVDLAWTDNADNEDGFKIERSTDGVSFTQISAVTANNTSYSDNSGAASTIYTYRVRAYNNAGDSPYSNTATATTSPAPVTIPAAPSGLAATAVSSTEVDLGWTDNADNEDGFKIERSGDGVTFTQLATVAGNLTAYSDLSAAPSSTYYYRIVSYNSAGNSTYSNIATVTTPSVPIPVPSAPSGLTATAISSTQVNLAWADNADNENGFKIERSTDGVSFSQIGTVAANITGYSDTAGTASTTYTYRVRAYNNTGDSSYSNTATATTAPPPVTIPSAPSGLTATAVSSTVVNLAWTDNANNEDGFKIERSNDGVTFAQLATAASNLTTYSDQSAAPSSTYYYRIAAYNSAGNSPYSNSATATTGSAATGSSRPYTATSPWNTPIGPNPQIDPNNAAYLTSLTGTFGSDPTQYTMPVYVIDASTPLQSVTLSGNYKTWPCGTCSFSIQTGTVSVPMPAGAQQASGSDAQIILWNPSTGDEYEFFGYSASTHTAKNGYHYNSQWSAVVVPGDGPRGAGIAYLAGLIRPWEIAQGHIDHAIAFAYQNSKNTYVWPAAKTDGSCGTSTCLPEGMRLQLDPTLDINSLGLSPAGKIIAKALQDYGMIIIDKAGHPKVYAEYEGTAHWNGTITSGTVSTIPLNRFRVLDPNYHIGQGP